MEIRTTALDGVLEIVPVRRYDPRGFFSETYNRQRYAQAGISIDFVQDNHSHSAHRNVLRGLHYQLPPHAQDKLISVVRGAIFDVAVDIRRGSPTFGRWVSVELSAAKWNQLLVPKGFAHGYLTLEDETEVVYKVSDIYSPAHERAIRYDDPDIGIGWPSGTDEFLVSEKDAKAPPFADAELFG